jgi:hypothetical protein
MSVTAWSPALTVMAYWLESVGRLRPVSVTRGVLVTGSRAMARSIACASRKLL